MFVGHPRLALMTAVLVVALVLSGRQPAVQAQPTFRVVHYFPAGDDAGSPQTGLMVDWDGSLYGMSRAQTNLKAFGLTPDNHYFWYGDIPGSGPNPPDGACYGRALIMGGDGRFYGATYDGGASNVGSLARTLAILAATPNQSRHAMTDGVSPIEVSPLTDMIAIAARAIQRPTPRNTVCQQKSRR
jgi:hypothetical protein